MFVFIGNLSSVLFFFALFSLSYYYNHNYSSLLHIYSYICIYMSVCVWVCMYVIRYKYKYGYLIVGKCLYFFDLLISSNLYHKPRAFN